MAIKLGKAIEDLEQPKPIPNGDYQLRLTDLTRETNSKGTADNIVTTHQIIADPEFGGRTIRNWLSIPAEGDSEREIPNMGLKEDGSAYTLLDLKGLRFKQFAEAHSLEFNPNDIPESKEEAIRLGWINATCIASVKQRVNKETGDSFPSIARFKY